MAQLEGDVFQCVQTRVGARCFPCFACLALPRLRCLPCSPGHVCLPCFACLSCVARLFACLAHPSKWLGPRTQNIASHLSMSLIPESCPWDTYFSPPQKTALWQLGAQPQSACFVLSWRAHNCLRLCICMNFGNNVCLYALCVLYALFTQVVRTYGS